MKTLDRYILRSFLFAAVTWFLIFMSLRVLIDMFVNFDEFAKQKVSVSETIFHICNYYGYNSLVYFVELGGVIIVVSAVTTLVMMNRTNELTAILASGVSLHRVLWPIVGMAVLLSGLVVLDQEVIIPRVSDKLVWSHDDVPGTVEFPVRMVTDRTQAVWYARRFKQRLDSMETVLVFLRDKDGNPLGYIQGRRAQPLRLEGEAGWAISDSTLVRAGASWQDLPDVGRVFTAVNLEAILRQKELEDGKPLPADRVTRTDPITIRDAAYGLCIQAEALEIDPVLSGRPREARLIRPTFTFTVNQEGKDANGQPGIQRQVLGKFFALSASWRPRQGKNADNDHWALVDGKLFYPTDLTGEQLALLRSSSWLQLMSTSELNRLLAMERVADKQGAMLIKHVRFTEPVNNLLMLLLGVPFVLSRERKIKASLALCLLTVGGFFALVYACRYMDLPPTLAAWLPILLFGPVAVVMTDAIKT